MDTTELNAFFQETSLLPSPEELKKSAFFLTTLQKWNPFYHFMKFSSSQELFYSHFFDSLQALSVLKEMMGWFPSSHQIKIADLGTGVGFPGLVLALFLPEVSFTLIERQSKKVAFLKLVVAQIGLNNVQILQENLTKNSIKNSRVCFDVLLFRAFIQPSSDFYSFLASLLCPTGKLVLYHNQPADSLPFQRSFSSWFSLKQSLPVHYQNKQRFIHLYEKITL